MTSKFSIDNRELLQRISSGEAVVGIDFGNLIVRELAAFRLAAMDSEQYQVVPDAATAIRACMSEFPESVRDIVEECADIAENACRAAMLNQK